MDTTICFGDCLTFNFYYYYSFVLLETGDSRPILRRLDRVIGLPEETALMLRDYEYTLFRHTSVDQLLKGLAKVLNRPQHPSDREKKHIQDVCHFQKIVSHFYLVSKIKYYICLLRNSGHFCAKATLHPREWLRKRGP